MEEYYCIRCEMKMPHESGKTDFTKSMYFCIGCGLTLPQQIKDSGLTDKLQKQSN